MDTTTASEGRWYNGMVNPQIFWEALTDIFYFFTSFVFARPEDIKNHPINMEPTPPATPPIVITPAVPKYLWNTTADARHSVRVICDEEGLTTEQKNTMCATIGGESGWDINAVNENVYKHKVTSTDYGICQWNNMYHGKEISPDEALHNPEKAVRLMCAYWKRGERDTWIAYKNQRYLKFM